MGNLDCNEGRQEHGTDTGPATQRAALQNETRATRRFNSGDEWLAFLKARFGANWAICPKTRRNRAKYTCITQAEYTAAERAFQGAAS